MSALTVDECSLRSAATQLGEAVDSIDRASRRCSGAWVPDPGISACGVELEDARARVERASGDLGKVHLALSGLELQLQLGAGMYEAADAVAMQAVKTVLGSSALLVGWAPPLVGAGLVAFGALIVWGPTAVRNIVDETLDSMAEGRLPTLEELAQTANPVGSRAFPDWLRIGVEYLDEATVGVPTPFKPPHIVSPVATALGSDPKRPVSVEPTRDPVTSYTGAQQGSADARKPITTPPSGYGQLMDRIPPSEKEGPQVRITTYQDADGNTFYEVLVAGTADQGFGDSDGPNDNLGNGAAFAGHDTELIQATEAAMRAAGIEEGDRVVFGGYSQGGLVASHLAASGDYNCDTLVVAGSPVGDINVSGVENVVEFVHTEDPIPALEGIRDLGQDYSTIVSRSVEDEPGVAGDPLGAHHQHHYVETAQMVDDSSAGELEDIQESFAAAYEGATVVDSESYRVERAGG
ncbi:hypothetical protein JRG19_00275 [Pseudoclavibacter alba]|uniref:hypothetical protein n=1 Tax=Pseudoclavibacter albus TaxID=272241 RepID=UPI0019D29808|nr:hypothetical protein [Pseudoclavibacter alba]MBN6776989.1 hypothetical protein [Pseudoclavibacter alba]